VASFNSGTIGEFNASTGAVINASLISGLSHPFCVALDGSGDLFVASFNSSGTIGEFNASTGAVINPSLISGLNGPTFIALAPTPEPSSLVLTLIGGALAVCWRARRRRRMAA